MATNQDPNAVAQRWAQRLGASTDKMRTSVQSMTTSPTQSAAQSADLWQQRLADPATKSKYISGLQRVSLADWTNAFLTKGINRVGSGATAAIPKMTSFMTQFLPFVNNVAQTVRQMPKNTLDDRINRAVAQMRGAATFKRQ